MTLKNRRALALAINNTFAGMLALVLNKRVDENSTTDALLVALREQVGTKCLSTILDASLADVLESFTVRDLFNMLTLLEAAGAAEVKE